MIAAIGTLLGGLVAVAALLWGDKILVGSEDGKTSGPDARPSKVEVAPDRLFGPGPMLIDTCCSVDLDKAPPERGAISGDLYFWRDETTIQAGSDGGAYVWRGDGDPSASDCATYLSTLSTINRIPAEPGLKACVRTSEGRTAFVVIKAINSNSWEIDVTVWKQRLS
ncbi:MAG TPA: hypothetical protein DGG94_02300 [Micromonosporaceae bacterium]|nr:hypothetical protein [Micromonosporaceae bacterium]HCU48653.1 hypothetical protein [Micromonosporaceae bacterium]